MIPNCIRSKFELNLRHYILIVHFGALSLSQAPTFVSLLLHPELNLILLFVLLIVVMTVDFQS